MKDNNPLFSVIIPTYNRSFLLENAIKSVLNQTFEDWELIIVDDESTDDTKKLINRFEDNRIRYLFQSKKERSAARNAGIKTANGTYICLLDDDDYFLQNHLQLFYEFILNNNYPETIIRSGYFKEFEDGKRVRSTNYKEHKHNNPVYYAAYNMCGVWSLCIPSIFLDKDNFPEDFPHWQDTHLILRLLSKYTFHQLDEYSYIYRIHQKMGSISLFTKKDFIIRMNLNLAAIKDLFDNHNKLISPYLEKNTKSFLLAEKQLQYAVRAVKILGRAHGLKIYFQSLQVHISLKNWKHHLAFWVSMVNPSHF